MQFKIYIANYLLLVLYFANGCSPVRREGQGTRSGIYFVQPINQLNKERVIKNSTLTLLILNGGLGKRIHQNIGSSLLFDNFSYFNCYSYHVVFRQQSTDAQLVCTYSRPYNKIMCLFKTDIDTLIIIQLHNTV